eukprot:XP_014038927.1 PREDICTED: uncharacterized protein LOC106592141 [Salmo salar]
MGKVHIAFILGKSRVTPLKQMTIPRLELAAATLAVRVERMLRLELQIELEESTFWTDSQSVLKYIRNDTKRFHTFVANRVAMIRDLSKAKQWRYLNSKHNPADDASRGLHVEIFLNSKRWRKGPEFLEKTETQWPEVPEELGSIPSDDPEVRKDVIVNSTCVEEKSPTSKLIEYYSTWNSLKKAVAWMLKLKRLLIQLSQKRKVLTQTDPGSDQSLTNSLKEQIDKFKLTFGKESLSVDDLDEAEKAIIRFEQLQHYKQEITLVVKGKQCAKRNGSICKLDPIVDNGILRVGGRLSKAAMPTELKNPMILPKDSYISRLILLHIHEQVKRGRVHVKRYGVIFTFLVSRAVHLEVASYLDTDSCINALRRFICRRGPVTSIRTDNGTNFVGTHRELGEALKELDHNKIQNELLKEGVTWSFNPPSGAHHGGVWERLIRLVKKILYSVLKEQVLDDEALQTALCEVEAIMNDRPITTVTNDPNDLEPLTPNHLLHLKAKPVLPPGLFQRSDLYSRRRWKQVQYITDLFWKRWIREYLPLMQERNKWNKTKRNFSPGDLVVIVDDTAPRNSWLMGHVVEALPGAKVVLGQDGWTVTYTKNSICVLKGSSVELSCMYTYPNGTVTTAFWFTELGTGKEPDSLGQDPEYAGRLEYHGDKKKDSILKITDLRESDSAEYKIRLITDQAGGKYIGSPGVTLSVTGLQVKVTGKTLTCSTTCTLTDNPTYIWYKNGHKVKEDTSSLYSDYFSDADSYSCAVKGHKDLHSLAVCRNCWIVTYTHQSICALKGSTVDISCSYTYPSDHEIKNTFWFTKWESDMDPEDLSSVPGYKGHIEYLGDMKSEGTLRLTDLRIGA